MPENTLKKLQEIGQSIWLDNLSRKLMDSGALQKWIEKGLTGITSNPSIFQKAISGSTDYDETIRRLIKDGTRDEREIFLGLAFEDIARAADLLWPVYQRTGGRDGFVSIEVSPDLAYDPQGTAREAKRLFSTLGKKNVLVKVPATRPGLTAIEELIREGINVNVTLLFSVKRYEEVAAAYIRGLEARVRQGKPIQEIASVASFFVSRVDTLADRLLEKRLAETASAEEKKKTEGMIGRAAVANAQVAYKKYREIFWKEDFRMMRGAHVQRILWGSTGTKNPKYSDLKYVEELMGPDSINTLPDAALNALMDHGRVRVSIEDGLDRAEKLFSEMKSVGIDIDKVTDQLESEGVKLFSDSFFALLKEIAGKRDSFLAY